MSAARKAAAPRVALYARVSTGEQTARNQTRELREYAKRRGWRMAGDYVDEGISGAKASRPALDRLMADAKKGSFGVVLVWRFDRFARSTTHLLSALEEFRVLGIDFVSLQESIDTGTPMGRMVFTICAAVAELERSLIRERVMAGLARARAEGKALGRPPKPLDTRAIVALRRSGWAIRKIATHLHTSKSTVARCLRQQARSYAK